MLMTPCFGIRPTEFGMHINYIHNEMPIWPRTFPGLDLISLNGRTTYIDLLAWFSDRAQLFFAYYVLAFLAVFTQNILQIE